MQSIVEGTAKNKLIKAMSTRTLPAGEQHEYQVGEEVEFFRPPSTKDISGWHGPTRISDISTMTRGVIKIKHEGQEMKCRCGDIRRYLDYYVFLTSQSAEGLNPHNTHVSAWACIRNALELMRPDTIQYFGYVHSATWWHITADSK